MHIKMHAYKDVYAYYYISLKKKINIVIFAIDYTCQIKFGFYEKLIEIV